MYVFWFGLTLSSCVTLFAQGLIIIGFKYSFRQSTQQEIEMSCDWIFIVYYLFRHVLLGLVLDCLFTCLLLGLWISCYCPNILSCLYRIVLVTCPKVCALTRSTRSLVLSFARKLALDSNVYSFIMFKLLWASSLRVYPGLLCALSLKASLSCSQQVLAYRSFARYLVPRISRSGSQTCVRPKGLTSWGLSFMSLVIHSFTTFTHIKLIHSRVASLLQSCEQAHL